MAKLLAILVLITSLLQLSQAGAYLGCFDKTKWLYSYKAFSSTLEAGKRWTIETCQAECTRKAYPLLGLAVTSTECLCGITVPNGGAQLPDVICSTAATENATALYYSTWDGTKGCRIAPLPFNNETWNVPEWSADRVTFFASNDTAILKMPVMDGPKIHSKEASSFGVYSARLLVSPVGGVISTFYLTSDNTNANTNQDEIDFEFVNGMKGIPTWYQGSLWINHFVNAQEFKHTLMEPPELQSKSAQPSFSTYSAWHTYTIDWQPSHIRWYVDGRLLEERTSAAYPVPTTPQHLTFSMWSKTSIALTKDPRDTWGGTFDPNHPEPFYSYVSNPTRVICDLPKPQDMATGAAKVPATYDTPTPQPGPEVAGKPAVLPLPAALPRPLLLSAPAPAATLPPRWLSRLGELAGSARAALSGAAAAAAAPSPAPAVSVERTAREADVAPGNTAAAGAVARNSAAVAAAPAPGLAVAALLAASVLLGCVLW